MAPQVVRHPGARIKGDSPMTTTNSTAPAPPHPSTTECFACYEGVVYIGHLIEDEDGDTAEVFEPVPCRRCATR